MSAIPSAAERFPSRPSSRKAIDETAEARRLAALKKVQDKEADRLIAEGDKERAYQDRLYDEAIASIGRSPEEAMRRQIAERDAYFAERNAAKQPTSPSIPPGPAPSPTSVRGSRQPMRGGFTPQDVKDAETTFREGKFLGMAPPSWVTNRPDQMDPNRSSVQQMQEYLASQGMGGGQFGAQRPGASPQGAPQPGPMTQGAPSPTRQPAQFAVSAPEPTNLPMGLGEGGKPLPMNFDPEAMAQEYERTPMQGDRRDQGMYTGFAQESKNSALESLKRAAVNVAQDPRFTPEQRAAAFERIRGKMSEIEENFAAGGDLLQSPTGFDAPPPEEFGLLQPTGLSPVGGGRLRNPETGDVLDTVRAPTGELVPTNLTTPEIEALPQGTRYMDSSGKIQIAGGGAGGRGEARAGGGGAGGARTPSGPGQFASPQEALAAYEKWNKAQGPEFTKSESALVDRILQNVPEDQREDVESQVLSNPEGAASILQQFAGGMNVAAELEDARIGDFTETEKTRGERARKLGRQFGIEEPEEAKPTIDPKRYFTETGMRGTTRAMRRGSDVSIPVTETPDGQMLLAPESPRQLADLEQDTEFVNVSPAPGGLERRVLPFSEERVNLGNFALTDAQRKVVSKEMASIRPRDPAVWKQFEDQLGNYAVVNEPWDPNNLTPAQEKLQDFVGQFYSELSPAGKAMMTMYVAHSLGHVVDPKRGGFTSTGWYGKKAMQNRQQAQPPAAGQGADAQDINAQMNSMMSVMDDESLGTRLGRGMSLLTGGDAVEDNKSKREKQAFEMVKTLAGSIESQFPDIPRGSPEFKAKAAEEIARIIKSHADRLPADAGRAGLSKLNAIQDRLLEGFGIQKETEKPPKVEPYRPRTREEMLQGFAEAWRKQRGL